MTERNFIYDRTQKDVDRVKELSEIGWKNMSQEEKTEWMSAMKGSLNTSDLERIRDNMRHIAALLNIELQSGTEQIPEVPRQGYFVLITQNLDCLKAPGYGYHTTPNTPTQPLNTIGKINDVERIQHDIYTNFMENLDNKAYCGEFYAGENFI